MAFSCFVIHLEMPPDEHPWDGAWLSYLLSYLRIKCSARIGWQRGGDAFFWSVLLSADDDGKFALNAFIELSCLLRHLCFLQWFHSIVYEPSNVAYLRFWNSFAIIIKNISMHDTSNTGTERIGSLRRRSCRRQMTPHHSCLVGQSPGKSWVTGGCIDPRGVCVLKHASLCPFFMEFWEAGGSGGDLAGLPMWCLGDAWKNLISQRRRWGMLKITWRLKERQFLLFQTLSLYASGCGWSNIRKPFEFFSICLSVVVPSADLLSVYLREVL